MKKNKINSARIKHLQEENAKLASERARFSKESHDAKDKIEDLKFEISARDKKLEHMAELEVYFC